MSRLSRFRATVGIPVAQLRHERMRTVLAVLGVAMAVLAAVLPVKILHVADTTPVGAMGSPSNGHRSAIRRAHRRHRVRTPPSRSQ